MDKTVVDVILGAGALVLLILYIGRRNRRKKTEQANDDLYR